MSYQVYKHTEMADRDRSHTAIVATALAEAKMETGLTDWSVRAVDWYVDVLDEEGKPAVVSTVWLQRLKDSDEPQDYDDDEA